MRRTAPRRMAPLDLDAPKRRRYPVVGVLAGQTVTHLPTGTTGTVERFLNRELRLRTPGGSRVFPVVPGEFVVDGVQCEPVVGRAERAPEPRVSASGSIVVDHDARVARASRILVEGVHDAELVEKVWGDDLRYEGVVIERLDGMDDLAAVVADFAPSPTRRLGILLDHLVDGTKESRVAAAISDPNVCITGHPYVDVWEAVRPRVAGIDAWPTVPKGEEWKQGVLVRIGRADLTPGEYWRELLAEVSSYTDLQAPLIGAVEELIDFVTEP